MRKPFLLAGLALLAGCAYPNPQHVAALNALVGKSEADVVRSYGVPVRSVETGGSKFIAYSTHRIESFRKAHTGAMAGAAAGAGAAVSAIPISSNSTAKPRSNCRAASSKPGASAATPADRAKRRGDTDYADYADWFVAFIG